MFEKDKLKLQIDFLQKNNEFKIVYSNYIVLNENLKKYIRFSKKLHSGFITQSLLNNYTLGILTILLEKNYTKKIF